MTDVWERRLRRAAELEKQWPYAAEILRAYRGLLAVQRRIYAEVPQFFPPEEKDFTGWFMRKIKELIGWVEEQGPPKLSQEARSWKEGVETRWWDEHQRPHQPAGHCMDCPSPLYHFLVRAFSAPQFMFSREHHPKPPEPASSEPRSACGHCRSLPAASLLREDKTAEALRRSLVCSSCANEWDFPRVQCPSCHEQTPEKLPRYTAQEIPWIRVEGCDTCKSYLKSIDLTQCPDAEPVVDELASLPLDVIAHERGYTKITPNLAGL